MTAPTLTHRIGGDWIASGPTTPDHSPADPDVVAAILFATGSKSVHTVIVDGRVVIEAGRPRLLDAETVYRGADAAAAAVLGRMGYRKPERWPRIA